MLAADLHAQLAEVSSMYYEEDLTQSAIAERLGLSRVKIYRLLKQAKEEQVVQIAISWPIQRVPHLEEALIRTFDLREALVLKSSFDDQLATFRQVAQLAARYLETVLADGMTMTVCLGRTTYEVIHAIRPGFRARIDVAQAVGSMPFATQEMDSAALARQLAQKLGGKALHLSAPLMADNPEAAAVLTDQSEIRRVLVAARQADLALLGIGNLDSATSGFVKGGFITVQEMAELRAGGAVGDIAGRVFTDAGQPYPCAFNERIIGVTLDDLRTIKTTIAVAMGTDKTAAIRGALRLGVVDLLCTDDHTAAAVLAGEEP
jgi:DNA-binding transcriptional regulator LsrR (DeoR family)